MNGESSPLLQLRDIHAPLPPALWPPAPGWWLLGLLLLGLLVTLSVWGVRRWRHVRLRRRVMRELQQMNGDSAPGESLARISTLLKQVALCRYPRREVAALSGQRWLEFLDRTGGNGRFVEGPGQLLASGPYAPPDSPHAATEIDALIDLGRTWVRKNL